MNEILGLVAMSIADAPFFERNEFSIWHVFNHNRFHWKMNGKHILKVKVFGWSDAIDKDGFVAPAPNFIATSSVEYP